MLFVGRHEPRKGLEVLLDAFVRLGPDVHLWVAGNGPQTVDLRERYPSERISWLGRIDDLELARRWRAAATYAAPSIGGESFGVVLLEAMAAGAPVVASNIAGYRQVARHEVDALLVEPGDAVALAKAIERVLGDPSLARAMRAAGRERARSFSTEVLAGRYEAIYESILAGRGADRGRGRDRFRSR